MLCDHSSLIYQEIVYVWSIADIHKVVDIADILASEGCKHCVALPPSPLGLAIAAAILASTRPAGPCCCNPCCANSVSLQRAMRADECQLHTAVCRDRKQPGAVQSATAGPRPSRRSLDTLRALHPPPMHPSPPPRNAERKDCKARRCAVRRIAGLLSCAHTLAHYD